MLNRSVSPIGKTTPLKIENDFRVNWYPHVNPLNLNISPNRTPKSSKIQPKSKLPTNSNSQTSTKKSPKTQKSNPNDQPKTLLKSPLFSQSGLMGTHRFTNPTH
ncbi:hypothetical protein Droror1_Dr00026664 [Drosera rotundifolia]